MLPCSSRPLCAMSSPPHTAATPQQQQSTPFSPQGLPLVLTEVLRHSDASDPTLSHHALQLALAAPPLSMCAALPAMMSTAVDIAGGWTAPLACAAADVAARCLQTLATPSPADVAAACTPLLGQALQAIGVDEDSTQPYTVCVRRLGEVLGDGPLLGALAALVGHSDASVQHRALRLVSAKVR